MLTPAEAERMRAVQSSRRCGAALERQYVAEAYGESRRRPSARRYQPPSSSSGPAALSSVPPPVPQYVPPLTKSSVPQPLIHQRPSTPTDERPYLELLGPFSPVSPPSTVPYLPAGYPASDMSAFSLSSGGLNNDTELSEFGDASPSWLADSMLDLAAVRTITLGPPSHTADELQASRRINPPPFISRGTQTDVDPVAVDAPVMIDAAVNALLMVDTGTDARRLPAPVLEPPVVAFAVLAKRILATVPPEMSLGQQRAVELAIRFSADVLHASADLILSALEASFGHLVELRPQDMLRFVIDYIDC